MKECTGFTEAWTDQKSIPPMRGASADAKRRDAMAMAAAPYLHPRLSSVEVYLKMASVWHQMAQRWEKKS